MCNFSSTRACGKKKMKNRDDYRLSTLTLLRGGRSEDYVRRDTTSSILNVWKQRSLLPGCNNARNQQKVWRGERERDPPIYNEGLSQPPKSEDKGERAHTHTHITHCTHLSWWLFSSGDDEKSLSSVLSRRRRTLSLSLVHAHTALLERRCCTVQRLRL